MLTLSVSFRNSDNPYVNHLCNVQTLTQSLNTLGNMAPQGVLGH